MVQLEGAYGIVQGYTSRVFLYILFGWFFGNLFLIPRQAVGCIFKAVSLPPQKKLYARF